MKHRPRACLGNGARVPRRKVVAGLALLLALGVSAWALNQTPPGSLEGMLLLLGGELLALGYLLTKSHQHSVEAHAQQARRAAIVDVVNDAIIGETLDGTITEWNPAAERLFGYAAAEAVGRTLDHLIVPPEREAEAATVLERLRRGEAVNNLVTRRQRRDGTPLDVLSGTAPIRDAAGRVIGGVTTLRDITELKEAERRLQESYECYRVLVENSVDGILVHDAGLRYVEVNPAACRMLGYRREDILGLTVLDMIEEDEEARDGPDVDRFHGGEARPSEYRCRRKDGSMFIGEVTGTALPDGRFLGILRDITERKAAEQAIQALNAELERRVADRTAQLSRANAELETREQRHRLALETLEIGEWELNLDDQTVVGSALFGRIHGDADPALEWTYETLQQRVLPEDRERVHRLIQQALASPGIWDCEYRIQRRDGAIRWLYARGQRTDGQGSRNILFGVVVDITERKRSELALRESETHFRGMMDSMPAMVWLMGPDQQVYFFNKTALEFRGRTLEQELGIGWIEGLHPDDHARTRSLIAEAFAAGATFSLDVRLRRHDGEYRWIQGVGVPRWDEAGQFIGYIGTCVDIEDRKRAERQVLELNASLERKVVERTAQLEAASAAKTQFLAHMSHELRTPMNAILGFAQVLEHDRVTPDQHEMIGMIREAGGHLLDIIGDILDLSKIEAGKLRLERQAFTLLPLLERVGRMISPFARDKGLDFTIQRPQRDQGVLLGDPQRIEQILINLTSNAIKFTERGEVVLTVTAIPTSDDLSRWRFTVRDTGIGIPAETLGKLFQPFSQGDDSITRQFGGTGLGLVISRRLVDMMGGEMGVSSQVGQGSMFWFELVFPRARGAGDVAAGLAPAAAPAIVPTLTGLRVLAVDDSPINLRMLEMALRRLGVLVTPSRNGREALDVLKASPRGFDLVLMDIQMPVMDGLRATREIRQDPALKTLPVIALTAGVLPDERQAAMAAGVNDFLGKPLDLGLLRASLDKLVAAGNFHAP